MSRPHAEKPWTPDDLARLRVEWAAGTPTLAIGEKLRRTKHSVIGKVHGLGLPSRPSPVKRHPPGTPKPVKPPPPPRSVGPTLPGVPAAPPPPVPTGWTRDCQWPVGHPGSAAFHLCGARAERGRPYCAEHVKAAYRQPEKESTT